MGKKGYSLPAKLFLAAYNLFQIAGWCMILGLMGHALMQGTRFNHLYAVVVTPLRFFQTVMLIEILFALVGLVPGKPHLTFMQLWGRVFSLYCIYKVPALENSYVTSVMMIAWSLSEITRFPFYFFKLFDKEFYYLSLMRYTNFMFLYPPGVSGEWLTQWNSIPYFMGVDIPYIPLDLKAGHLIYVTAAFYPIGFAMLFLYLFAARTKFMKETAKKQK